MMIFNSLLENISIKIKLLIRLDKKISKNWIE